MALRQLSPNKGHGGSGQRSGSGASAKVGDSSSSLGGGGGRRLVGNYPFVASSVEQATSARDGKRPASANTAQLRQTLGSPIKSMRTVDGLYDPYRSGASGGLSYAEVTAAAIGPHSSYSEDAAPQPPLQTATYIDARGAERLNNSYASQFAALRHYHEYRNNQNYNSNPNGEGGDEALDLSAITTGTSHPQPKSRRGERQQQQGNGGQRGPHRDPISEGKAPSDDGREEDYRMIGTSADYRPVSNAPASSNNKYRASITPRSAEVDAMYGHKGLDLPLSSSDNYTDAAGRRKESQPVAKKALSASVAAATKKSTQQQQPKLSKSSSAQQQQREASAMFASVFLSSAAGPSSSVARHRTTSAPANAPHMAASSSSSLGMKAKGSTAASRSSSAAKAGQQVPLKRTQQIAYVAHGASPLQPRDTPQGAANSAAAHTSRAQQQQQHANTNSHRPPAELIEYSNATESTASALYPSASSPSPAPIAASSSSEAPQHSFAAPSPQAASHEFLAESPAADWQFLSLTATPRALLSHVQSLWDAVALPAAARVLFTNRHVRPFLALSLGAASEAEAAAAGVGVGSTFPYPTAGASAMPPVGSALGIAGANGGAASPDVPPALAMLLGDSVHRLAFHRRQIALHCLVLAHERRLLERIVLAREGRRAAMAALRETAVRYRHWSAQHMKLTSGTASSVSGGSGVHHHSDAAAHVGALGTPHQRSAYASVDLVLRDLHAGLDVYRAATAAVVESVLAYEGFVFGVGDRQTRALLGVASNQTFALAGGASSLQHTAATEPPPMPYNVLGSDLIARASAFAAASQHARRQMQHMTARQQAEWLAKDFAERTAQRQERRRQQRDDEAAEMNSSMLSSASMTAFSDRGGGGSPLRRVGFDSPTRSSSAKVKSVSARAYQMSPKRQTPVGHESRAPEGLNLRPEPDGATSLAKRPVGERRRAAAVARENEAALDLSIIFDRAASAAKADRSDRRGGVSGGGSTDGAADGSLANSGGLFEELSQSDYDEACAASRVLRRRFYDRKMGAAAPSLVPASPTSPHGRKRGGGALLSAHNDRWFDVPTLLCDAVKCRMQIAAIDRTVLAMRQQQDASADPPSGLEQQLLQRRRALADRVAKELTPLSDADQRCLLASSFPSLGGGNTSNSEGTANTAPKQHTSYVCRQMLRDLHTDVFAGEPALFLLGVTLDWNPMALPGPRWSCCVWRQTFGGGGSGNGTDSKDGGRCSGKRKALTASPSHSKRGSSGASLRPSVDWASRSLFGANGRALTRQIVNGEAVIGRKATFFRREALNTTYSHATAKVRLPTSATATAGFIRVGGISGNGSASSGGGAMALYCHPRSSPLFRHEFFAAVDGDARRHAQQHGMAVASQASFGAAAGSAGEARRIGALLKAGTVGAAAGSGGGAVVSVASLAAAYPPMPSPSSPTERPAPLSEADAAMLQRCGVCLDVLRRRVLAAGLITPIQALVRGVITRQRMRRRVEAACVVQQFMRGVPIRRAYLRQRGENRVRGALLPALRGLLARHRLGVTLNAVLRLQRVGRGFLLARGSFDHTAPKYDAFRAEAMAAIAVAASAMRHPQNQQVVGRGRLSDPPAPYWDALAKAGAVTLNNGNRSASVWLPRAAYRRADANHHRADPTPYAAVSLPRLAAARRTIGEFLLGVALRARRRRQRGLQWVLLLQRVGKGFAGRRKVSDRQQRRRARETRRRVAKRLEKCAADEVADRFAAVEDEARRREAMVAAALSERRGVAMRDFANRTRERLLAAATPTTPPANNESVIGDKSHGLDNYSPYRPYAERLGGGAESFSSPSSHLATAAAQQQQQQARLNSALQQQQQQMAVEFSGLLLRNAALEKEAMAAAALSDAQTRMFNVFTSRIVYPQHYFARCEEAWRIGSNAITEEEAAAISAIVVVMNGALQSLLLEVMARGRRGGDSASHGKEGKAKEGERDGSIMTPRAKSGLVSSPPPSPPPPPPLPSTAASVPLPGPRSTSGRAGFGMSPSAAASTATSAASSVDPPRPIPFGGGPHRQRTSAAEDMLRAGSANGGGGGGGAVKGGFARQDGKGPSAAALRPRRLTDGTSEAAPPNRIGGAGHHHHSSSAAASGPPPPPSLFGGAGRGRGPHQHQHQQLHHSHGLPDGGGFGGLPPNTASVASSSYGVNIPVRLGGGALQLVMPAANNVSAVTNSATNTPRGGGAAAAGLNATGALHSQSVNASSVVAAGALVVAKDATDADPIVSSLGPYERAKAEERRRVAEEYAALPAMVAKALAPHILRLQRVGRAFIGDGKFHHWPEDRAPWDHRLGRWHCRILFRGDALPRRALVAEQQRSFLEMIAEPFAREANLRPTAFLALRQEWLDTMLKALRRHSQRYEGRRRARLRKLAQFVILRPAIRLFWQQVNGTAPGPPPHQLPTKRAPSPPLAAKATIGANQSSSRAMVLARRNDLREEAQHANTDNKGEEGLSGFRLALRTMGTDAAAKRAASAERSAFLAALLGTEPAGELLLGSSSEKPTTYPYPTASSAAIAVATEAAVFLQRVGRHYLLRKRWLWTRRRYVTEPEAHARLAVCEMRGRVGIFMASQGALAAIVRRQTAHLQRQRLLRLTAVLHRSIAAATIRSAFRRMIVGAIAVYERGTAQYPSQQQQQQLGIGGASSAPMRRASDGTNAAADSVLVAAYHELERHRLRVSHNTSVASSFVDGPPRPMVGPSTPAAISTVAGGAPRRGGAVPAIPSKSAMTAVGGASDRGIPPRQSSPLRTTLANANVYVEEDSPPPRQQRPQTASRGRPQTPPLASAQPQPLPLYFEADSPPPPPPPPPLPSDRDSPARRADTVPPISVPTPATVGAAVGGGRYGAVGASSIGVVEGSAVCSSIGRESLDRSDSLPSTGRSAGTAAATGAREPPPFAPAHSISSGTNSSGTASPPQPMATIATAAPTPISSTVNAAKGSRTNFAFRLTPLMAIVRLQRRFRRRRMLRQASEERQALVEAARLSDAASMVQRWWLHRRDVRDAAEAAEAEEKAKAAVAAAELSAAAPQSASASSSLSPQKRRTVAFADEAVLDKGGAAAVEDPAAMLNATLAVQRWWMQRRAEVEAAKAMTATGSGQALHGGEAVGIASLDAEKEARAIVRVQAKVRAFLAMVRRRRLERQKAADDEARLQREAASLIAARWVQRRAVRQLQQEEEAAAVAAAAEEEDSPAAPPPPPLSIAPSAPGGSILKKEGSQPRGGSVPRFVTAEANATDSEEEEEEDIVVVTAADRQRETAAAAASPTRTNATVADSDDEEAVESAAINAPIIASEAGTSVTTHKAAASPHSASVAALKREAARSGSSSEASSPSQSPPQRYSVASGSNKAGHPKPNKTNNDSSAYESDDSPSPTRRRVHFGGNSNNNVSTYVVNEAAEEAHRRHKAALIAEVTGEGSEGDVMSAEALFAAQFLRAASSAAHVDDASTGNIDTDPATDIWGRLLPSPKTEKPIAASLGGEGNAANANAAPVLAVWDADGRSDGGVLGRASSPQADPHLQQQPADDDNGSADLFDYLLAPSKAKAVTTTAHTASAAGGLNSLAAGDSSRQLAHGVDVTSILHRPFRGTVTTDADRAKQEKEEKHGSLQNGGGVHHSPISTNIDASSVTASTIAMDSGNSRRHSTAAVQQEQQQQSAAAATAPTRITDDEMMALWGFPSSQPLSAPPAAAPASSVPTPAVAASATPRPQRPPTDVTDLVVGHSYTAAAAASPAAAFQRQFDGERMADAVLLEAHRRIKDEAAMHQQQQAHQQQLHQSVSPSKAVTGGYVISGYQHNNAGAALSVAIPTYQGGAAGASAWGAPTASQHQHQQALVNAQPNVNASTESVYVAPPASAPFQHPQPHPQSHPQAVATGRSGSVGRFVRSQHQSPATSAPTSRSTTPHQKGNSSAAPTNAQQSHAQQATGASVPIPARPPSAPAPAFLNPEALQVVGSSTAASPAAPSPVKVEANHAYHTAPSSLASSINTSLVLPSADEARPPLARAREGPTAARPQTPTQIGTATNGQQDSGRVGGGGGASAERKRWMATDPIQPMYASQQRMRGGGGGGSGVHVVGGFGYGIVGSAAHAKTAVVTQPPYAAFGTPMSSSPSAASSSSFAALRPSLSGAQQQQQQQRPPALTDTAPPSPFVSARSSNSQQEFTLHHHQRGGARVADEDEGSSRVSHLTDISAAASFAHLASANTTAVPSNGHSSSYAYSAGPQQQQQQQRPYAGRVSASALAAGVSTLAELSATVEPSDHLPPRAKDSFSAAARNVHHSLHDSSVYEAPPLAGGSRIGPKNTAAAAAEASRFAEREAAAERAAVAAYHAPQHEAPTRSGSIGRIRAVTIDDAQTRSTNASLFPSSTINITDGNASDNKSAARSPQAAARQFSRDPSVPAGGFWGPSATASGFSPNRQREATPQSPSTSQRLNPLRNSPQRPETRPPAMTVSDYLAAAGRGGSMSSAAASYSPAPARSGPSDNSSRIDRDAILAYHAPPLAPRGGGSLARGTSPPPFAPPHFGAGNFLVPANLTTPSGSAVPAIRVQGPSSDRPVRFPIRKGSRSPRSGSRAGSTASSSSNGGGGGYGAAYGSPAAALALTYSPEGHRVPLNKRAVDANYLSAHRRY